MTEKIIPISSKRAEDIKTFINEHQSCKKGVYPIIISGKRDDRPFYELPLDLLRYNAFNGRFTAERLSLKHEIGRELDSNDSEDAEVIRKILNGRHPTIQAENLTKEKAENLKKSIKESGQLSPGVITADGYVINGNRRMAIYRMGMDTIMNIMTLTS
ncbi:MAG: ParB N-terminal domain-containing protein [Candidatus Thermoplasmatota archaeon]|nr:ParB N-terminal domain-containing protein [Candidatus Thermoplasmatota archaeon]